MDSFSFTESDLFVPVLAWPGRRPSLGELASWHEALSDAIATQVRFDLMACWLYPSRGGSVLVGPPGLAEDRLVPPGAEPLVAQEGIFAIEDRVRWAGYRSVLAVPIRAETQDVGLLLVASFGEGSYSLEDQRTLYRCATLMAASCRRLAAHLWLPASPGGEDRDERGLLTERILDASGRARDGADLVQLSSDALAPLLAHDRLDLLAVAPAPECWALLATQQGRVQALERSDAERIDALVNRLGGRDLLRIADIHQSELFWPAAGNERSALRLRSLLAARLEMGNTIAGWLWLGSETPGWFREDDEELVRHLARLLAPSVAAWAARTEQAGAWR